MKIVDLLKFLNDKAKVTFQYLKKNKKLDLLISIIGFIFIIYYQSYDVMSFFLAIVYTVPNMQLLESRVNILGVVWVITLIYIVSGQFNHSFTKSRILSTLFAFSLVMLVQGCLDEMTVFVNVLFGGWNWFLLRADEFTLIGLLMMRWAIYASIVLTLCIFGTYNLFKYLQFSKLSMFYLSIFLVIAFYGGYIHYADYGLYLGFERVWRYWLVYPEVKLLWGLFCLSIVRKSGNKT